jgi:nicotinate dehydrogenase subunit A
LVIRFELNRRPIEIDVDPRAKLLYVLRNRLEACGTRFGCGAGACGACFVLVDGRALPSCDLAMEAVEGKAVVTIEGLGSPDAPHPLQRAFIEHQAVQCGFCASGILIRAAALLEECPHPSREQVVEALDRNLCRCGMQQRMVEAILWAAR